jgi:hypothetical protein
MFDLSARDLVIRLAEYYEFAGHRMGGDTPGSAIMRLPSDQRKLLKDLKSEDLADIRYPRYL